MYDIIALCDGILPPSDLEDMAQSEHIFDYFTYAGHELAVIELLAVKEFENDEKTAMMYQTYYAHALSLVNAFGIRTAEGLESPLTLKHLNALLEGLSVLDNPENQDLIQGHVTDTTEDAEYVLAMMLADVTEYTFGEIITWIDSVDIALMDKIKEISETDDVDFDMITRARMIRDKYLSFMQDQKSGPVYQFVINAKELPVARMAVHQATQDMIEEMSNPEMIAIELIAAEIISGTRDELLETSAKAYRFQMFPEKQNIDRYIDEHLEEFLSDD